MGNVVRVLLSDDHALIRGALRLMVERIEGVTVVAEAADGRAAVEQAILHRPDIALLDITMRDMNGIEALGRIREAVPSTRLVILSSHESPEFVLRALRAGAHGYLVKGATPDELATAIREVMAGRAYLSQSVSGHVVSGIRERSLAESPLDSLTPRQREILQMIAEGKSTKVIASTLDVSVKTAETHRAALMERLGIRDVAGLVLFAVRHGLVDPGRGGGG
jgi:DNA-binding NarL/FixJ family response regulator